MGHYFLDSRYVAKAFQIYKIHFISILLLGFIEIKLEKNIVSVFISEKREKENGERQRGIKSKRLGKECVCSVCELVSDDV